MDGPRHETDHPVSSTVPHWSRWVRIAIWSIPVLIFGYLLWQYVVPTGHLRVTFSPIEGHPRVKGFASKEPIRLLGAKNQEGADVGFQLITASPLYFDLLVPRAFERATVTIEYQNPNGQLLLQLGAGRTQASFSTTTLAYVNPTLDAMPLWWSAVRSGNLTLWQKNQAWYEKVRRTDAEQKAIETDAAERREVIEALGGDGGISDEQKKELARLDEETQAAVSGLVAGRNEPVSESPRYDSVDAFFRDLPSRDRVAGGNVPSFERYYRLPGYRPSPTGVTISTGLRSSLQFYTYVKDENLQFRFSFQDLNRHEDPDPVTVTVRRAGKTVATVNLPDDGNERGDGRITPERSLEVSLSKPEEGVYEFTLDTTYDVVTERIEAAQHLLVFSKRLFVTANPEYRSVLGDGPFSPTTLYLSGSKLRVKTAHSAGLQILTVADQSLRLSELHRWYERSDLTGVTRLVSPLNDIELETDGYLAFSAEQMFSPLYGQLTPLESVQSVDDFDFILVDAPPIESTADGWLRATATLGGTSLPIVGQRYHFAVLAPGMAESEKQLYVRSVTLDLRRPALTPQRLVAKVLRVLRGEK